MPTVSYQKNDFESKTWGSDIAGYSNTDQSYKTHSAYEVLF